MNLSLARDHLVSAIDYLTTRDRVICRNFVSTIKFAAKIILHVSIVRKPVKYQPNQFHSYKSDE